MYAKSFIALDGNGRLTGARTAQAAPYDRYTCHLCGSALQFHPQYQTERPWFEHQAVTLTYNGRQHCPYVKSEAGERGLVGRLQRVIPSATLVVRRADWHCNGCGNSYHGERYCLTCRTGEYSCECADVADAAPEITPCAC